MLAAKLAMAVDLRLSLPIPKGSARTIVPTVTPTTRNSSQSISAPTAGSPWARETKACRANSTSSRCSRASGWQPAARRARTGARDRERRPRGRFTEESLAFHLLHDPADPAHQAVGVERL